jgi:thiamine kinase-like enzyme
MNIPEIIKTEIAQSIGLKSDSLRITLRKPLDFYTNRLYDLCSDGRHFIVKEYLVVKELEVAPLREYCSLQLLAPLDIAPQPVFYDPTVGPIVVYEYMDGEMWDRQPITSGHLQQLAEIWLSINTAPAGWLARGAERRVHEVEDRFLQQLKRYRDWTIQEYPNGKQIAQSCLELLERRHPVFQELSDFTAQFCFCRADPRFANVIQRPDGRLGLVDWEDSGLRDPAKELADILTHPNQEDLANWDDWQAFVKPYLEYHNRADRTVTRRMQLYLVILPLFWFTGLIRQGMKLAASAELATWTVNGLPANERLSRYLARAIAWPEMDYHKALADLGAITFFPDGDGYGWNT